MSTTWFDESYPPSVLAPTPPIVPVTGAVGGTPGSWVPSDAYPIPASVAEANALGLALGAAWSTGQYVVLDNPSSTHTHWTGTAFASGNAPAPPVAPTLTAVAPNTGPAAGGTAVTLTGTGFTGATSASFGGNAPTAFAVVNATTITCTTPAHAEGAVTVAVQHPNGVANLPNGYTYAAAVEDVVEGRASSK